MTYQIIQTALTDDIKNKIFKGFSQHAIKETGMDGLTEAPISFEIHDKGEFIGAIVVQVFWGQLHIKYLYVSEHYRGKGIAMELMGRTFLFGKEQGCQFAFLETMSFQAIEFYQKAGFILEFTRHGYANGTSLHFLRKDL